MTGQWFFFFFGQEMGNWMLHFGRILVLILVVWNSSKPVAGRSHLVRYSAAALRPIKDLVTSNMHNLTFYFLYFLLYHRLLHLLFFLHHAHHN